MATPAAPAHAHLWENRTAVAGSAAVLAAILTAIGQFKDAVFADEWPAYAIELAAIAIATGLVFWLVVPRSLRGGNVRSIAMTGLIVSIVGFLSLVVFWLGLPSVLAAGGAYLAANAHEAAGAPRGLTIATFALAGLTVVLAIIIAFIG